MVRPARRRSALRATAALAAGAVGAGVVLAATTDPNDPRAGRRLETRLEYSPNHHNRHNAIVRVRTARPVVALTFDDGPDARVTPFVLRARAAARARATFFVIGRSAAARPGLVQAIVRGGHQVGEHSWSHAPLPPPRESGIRAEAARARRAIVAAGAPTPTGFRPPRGYFDEVVGAIAAQRGERMIGWDVSLDRELGGRSLPSGVARAVAAVRRGSIVLLHDGPAAGRRMLRALQPLLRGLRRRGLRSVTVAELLALAGR